MPPQPFPTALIGSVVLSSSTPVFGLLHRLSRATAAAAEPWAQTAAAGPAPDTVLLLTPSPLRVSDILTQHIAEDGVAFGFEQKPPGDPHRLTYSRVKAGSGWRRTGEYYYTPNISDCDTVSRPAWVRDIFAKLVFDGSLDPPQEGYTSSLWSKKLLPVWRKWEQIPGGMPNPRTDVKFWYEKFSRRVGARDVEESVYVLRERSWNHGRPDTGPQEGDPDFDQEEDRLIAPRASVTIMNRQWPNFSGTINVPVLTEAPDLQIVSSVVQPENKFDVLLVKCAFLSGEEVGVFEVSSEDALASELGQHLEREFPGRNIKLVHAEAAGNYTNGLIYTTAEQVYKA